jgi:hypothetical protein
MRQGRLKVNACNRVGPPQNPFHISPTSGLKQKRKEEAELWGVISLFNGTLSASTTFAPSTVTADSLPN